MRGKPCSIEPPTWRAPQENGITVKLCNVTPIFGGGYEAREVDTECLIRPAAIRGQLRFWWRATVGAQFETAQQLFAEEEAVWGSAQEKGSVSISVQVLTREQDAVRVPINIREVPTYVQAILTQGRGSSVPFVYQNVKFTLTITAKTPDILSEASRALNAFVRYGGIGGRTRRGFGCLDWDELPEQSASAVALSPTPWQPPFGIPSLVGARLYVGPERSVEQSWSDAVRMLSRFRRAVAPDSNRERPTNGPQSHSPWPEADMLRKLGRIPQLNRASGDIQGALPFPRAQLGLPLKFQSMARHAGSFQPAEMKLKVSDELVDRLASPVIVRPVRIGNSWRPGVLILNSSPIPDGRLAIVGYRETLSVECTGWPATLYMDGAEIAFNHASNNTLDAFAEFIMRDAGWRAERIDGV